MTTLTPSRLREMIEAAERATPGPWEWLGNNMLQSIRCDEILFATDDGRDWGMHRPMMQHHWDGATAEANMDHIAACDPQTIIALCRIALAAKAITEYEQTGGPDHLEWDKYYERMAGALRDAGLI